MDIASLKAFQAVAETGSFSKASEQLFLTQPAISKRVSALETTLNTKLFDRIGRSITLTAAGHTLLPRAHRILLEIEDSVRALTNLSGEINGRLSFATSHHIGLHRLPNALRRYTKAHPDVRLDISFMDSETACQAVAHGDMELGIVTLPLTPDEHIATQAIWDDPLTIVVSSNHPLANKTRIALNQLAHYPAILPAANTYTRQIAEQAFKRLGLELDIALSTNYLETIRMLVTVGIGWSVLPETMLDKKLQSIRIRQLQLKRTLGIVYHRERTLSNAATALITLLEK